VKNIIKKIKILSLSYCDSGGGAAVSFLRINSALSKSNFTKYLLVIEKRLNKKIIKIYGNNLDQIYRRIRFYIIKIIFFFDIKFTKSMNLINSGVGNYINKSSFDIINFHWIGCETISLSEIEKINKPIVWTMHDMWPITGIYHYSFDKKYFDSECKNFIKKKYFNILDNFIRKRKELLFKKKLINIVSPSKWLLEEAKKKKLPFGMMKVIPYPVDTRYFKKSKNIRILKSKYNIPDNKKVLLFSSNILNETRKGSKILLNVIKNDFLSNNNYIIIMLGENNNFIDQKLSSEITFFGNVKNYSLVKDLYSISDVLLYPSLIDNLPNTILEAMSCGLPCVAFNCYGMKEIITHKKDGYLAKPYSVEDFKRGIKYILLNRGKLAYNARSNMRNNYSLEIINSKYYKFLNSILF
jgi:glycosyltransferase involved in cell wall biosynthesis